MKKVDKTTAKKNAEFNFRTITSFEKACERRNIPTDLPDVSMIPESLRAALIAVYKLFIIFEAINDTDVIDMQYFNQVKYYPWLPVLSSGFGFSSSTYAYDYTHSGVGSRLCTIRKDKTLFIGQQFGVDGSEYKDLFLKHQ